MLRIQFCLSVALMLVAFVCGIARVEIFELCVTISALIHYFTLVAMMWIATEAVLMLQKLVSATKTSAAYFVVASLICWGELYNHVIVCYSFEFARNLCTNRSFFCAVLPIPAVVVPIGIDRGYIIHEQ